AVVGEAADYHPVPGAQLPQQLDQGLFQAVLFEVHDHTHVGEGGEHLPEGGDADPPAPERELAVDPMAVTGVQLAQVGEGVGPHRTGPVGGAVDVVVVEAHQVPVGGDVEVGLEMVGAGLEGAAEGDHRV